MNAAQLLTWLLLTWLSCGRFHAEAPVGLPGAPERSLALEAALRARSPQATYVNRLVLEASPYLRLHANDPVEWYPWGEEALAAARDRGRLIFLSIGYTSCHWCHVMHEESFADEGIAKFLNENFVSIKVDREERPDVDAVYLEAVQAMIGRAGWPLTLILTPEGAPVFGATYLPARDGDRGASRGLMTALERVSAGWRDDRETLAAGAAQNSRILAEAARPKPPGTVPPAELVATAVSAVATGFDPVNGGFGGGPKFPRAPTLDLLLGVAARNHTAGEMAAFTLDKMATSGIHDHLAGGFHRYAVDGAWRMPHFEKMTTDNAQLARTYLLAWTITGDARHAEAARSALRGIDAVAVPTGGYGTGLDADSLGPDGRREEGGAYTWTQAELDGLLGPMATVAARHFGVGTPPDIDGRYALFLATTDVDAAVLAPLTTAMLASRQARPQPQLDDKVLASTNGLVLSALARSAFVLDDRSLRKQALTLVDTLGTLHMGDGRNRHLLGSDEPGTLEDHAAVAEGLLDAFVLAPQPRLLQAALAHLTAIRRHFGDGNGGLYRTPDDGEALLFRPWSDTDGAEPSGAAVAVQGFLRAHLLTGDARWQSAADQAFSAYAEGMTRAPTSHAAMVEALARRHRPPPEIVVVWPSGTDGGPLIAEVRRAALPGAAVICGASQELRPLVPMVPWLDGKLDVAAPTGYVCQGGACQAPTTDAGVFRGQIARAAAQ